MRSKILVVISVLVLASMMLAACAPAAPEKVVETVIVEKEGQTVVVTATPEEAAAGPKTLSYQIGVGDIPTLDPALSTDTNSTQVAMLTFVGLTRQDSVTTEVGPGMAESWEVSEDGKVYTFKLRQDVPWARYDGNEVVKVQDCEGNDRMVNANDFKYGILRTLKPETASDYAYVLSFALAGGAAYNDGSDTDPENVGVKVIDDYTLELTFNEAAAYNLNIAGMWVAYAQPSWLIDGDDCTEARSDRWTETGFFQGFGPYVLKEWVHDAYATVIKNPFWPGTDNIPQAKIDEVNFVMVDEPAGLAEYEAGNMEVTRVPLSDIDRVKSDPTLSAELTIAPELCTYYYGFNTTAKFVDDPRVRLALSQAIDRQSLIDNVTKGGQEPAQWFSRPGLAGAPTIDGYPDLGVKYDEAAAKASLEEYLTEENLTADQVEITLMFNTNAGHQKIAEAISQMWKDKLGITVNLVNQEWKVYLETIRSADTPQVWRLGWCQDYADANNFLKEVVTVNGSANPDADADGNPDGGFTWKNEEYEALVNQAATEPDLAKRTELYAQAEEILVLNDVVMAPIYWYTRVQVTKPNVVRTFSVLGGQEEMYKWDITQ